MSLDEDEHMSLDEDEHMSLDEDDHMSLDEDDHMSLDEDQHMSLDEVVLSRNKQLESSNKYLNDITLEFMVNKSRLKYSQTKVNNSLSDLDSNIYLVKIMEITNTLITNYKKKLSIDDYGNEIMKIFERYICDCTEILKRDG